MSPTQVAYKIPFDADGNIMRHAVEEWRRPSNVSKAHEWRDREPFEAKLRLINYTPSGRSTSYYTWQDTCGHTYPMGGMDMLHLIRSGVVIQNGMVTARWIASRMGDNFGIKLAS